ncbi:hypothetical protein I317_00243 [Kwoniella heveanensis CBS 569]|nr:hypothetical protein I317_00243 [Kwoniella heveanensis CBS 569]
MVALNLGSIGRTGGKKYNIPSSEHNNSPVFSKPTHFPATPYLQTLTPPPKLDDSISDVRRDPFARNDGLQHSSIYNTISSSSSSPDKEKNNKDSGKNTSPGRKSHEKRPHHPHHHHHRSQAQNHQRRDSEISLDRQVVDIVADYVRPSKDLPRPVSQSGVQLPDLLSALPSPILERPSPSRASSFADQSAPPSPRIAPSILSTESLLTPKAVARNSNMRNVYGGNNGGGGVRRGGSKASRTDKNLSPAMLEKMEELDEVRGLRSESMPHVLASFDRTFNQSATSVGSRAKADKMLGIDANAKLASLYLVSGLGKSTAQWSFADSDATRGVQPIEDSMGLFWRPEMLGSSFSGEKSEDPAKEGTRGREDSKSSTMTNGLSKDLRGKYVPDAEWILADIQRIVEVVNSTLSPPTTCHAFTFTIPRHDTLAAIARTRLDSAVSGLPNTYSMMSAADEQGFLDPNFPVSANGKPNVRSIASAMELTFYGVTLTVWTHADRDRALQLKAIKMRAERVKLGQGSLNSINPLTQRKGSTAPSEYKGTKRTSLQYMMSRDHSEGDVTASETETGMSDSDLEGPLGRRGMRVLSDRLSTVDSVPEDAAAPYDEARDIFWMPYAITMVSRFPIYDVLQDYLRLSWARFSKNAKVHMTQVNRLLNFDPPRPGDVFKIPVGEKPEDEVVVESHMPGGLMDFDKGLMKVDFQLWPLFQAIDLDHILTCAEVALSNSGRVIFCSKHPAMLNVAVSTLKYIVELRGWDGIAMPMIHARDTTFIIEDPGPYIIGMPTECRYLLAPPAEVVIVDIDTNSLSCKSPPAGIITPRQRREKVKQKLLAALGHHYPSDRSIPMEFKVSYPKGNFRNFNRFTYKGERPHYLGERLKAPSWWRHEAVISVFDKILADKHKKPSLIQRLMKTGMARPEAQLTVGEQIAKAIMRRRALHYVETRDDLELKVAKINRRLLRLIQEGDHWKKQFEKFEKYADRLTIEANELKTKIDRERREAKRLSNIANEQTKQNIELEEKLRNTEDARAEAMRQLSDMHQSIQELEREREEIMNSLETQSNGALAGLPGSLGSAYSDSSSRPATPNDTGSVRSKASSRSRPTTADSTLSKPLSVLGQVKGVKGSVGADGKLNKRASLITNGVSVTETSGTVGNGLGLGFSEKGQDMAKRVASIQAKLELALNVVSSQRSASAAPSSVPTDSEGEFDDAATQTGSDHEAEPEQDDTIINAKPIVVARLEAEGGAVTDRESESGEGGNKTPTASRRPSHADMLIAKPSTDIPPVPVPVAAAGGRSRSPQSAQTNRTAAAANEEFLSADEGLDEAAERKSLTPSIRSTSNGRAKPSTTSIKKQQPPGAFRASDNAKTNVNVDSGSGNTKTIIMRRDSRGKTRSKRDTNAGNANARTTKHGNSILTPKNSSGVGAMDSAASHSDEGGIDDVDGDSDSDSSGATAGGASGDRKTKVRSWDGGAAHGDDDKDGKRLSGMSTTTIAFGRAV